MDIKFISNEYIFKDNEHHVMIARMSNIDNIPMVEFSLNNRKIYYYLISEKKADNMSDLDIINEAVDKMREDKKRWIEDCSIYVENSEKFILQERATLYRVTIDALAKQYGTISIVEENNSRFTLRLREESSGTTMTTHLNVETREELIETMDSLCRLIINVLKPFRLKQEQVILNAFGTDYALRSSLDRLDSDL